MNKEQKLRITGRAFYNDNKDEYEDYNEAVVELSKTSESFIDFIFEANTPAKEGYLLLEKEGNLIYVNNETGHVLPCSDLDEDFGNELQEQSQEQVDLNPYEQDLVKLFSNIGWQEVVK